VSFPVAQYPVNLLEISNAASPKTRYGGPNAWELQMDHFFRMACLVVALLICGSAVLPQTVVAQECINNQCPK
jgi:hypothetical protein